MKKIKVGIIGCGEIATERHLPCWQKTDKGEVVAVVDIDEKKAKETAEKFGVPRYYTDYQEMLAKEEGLKIVDVCTPTKFHREHVVKACQKKKHVVVEKPMATSVRECSQMIEAAKKNKVNLTVCHTMRIYPVVKKIKKQIDKKIIGKIKIIHISTPYSELQPWVMAQGGALWELGIHRIYLMLYWLDEIDKVEAKTYTPQDPQENMEVVVSSKKGMGIYHLFKARGQEEEEIRIYGDKGMIRVPSLVFNLSLLLTILDRSWKETLFRKTRDYLVNLYGLSKRAVEYLTQGIKITPHFIIFNQFIEVVTKKQKKVLVSPEEGKRAVEILKEIERQL